MAPTRARMFSSQQGLFLALAFAELVVDPPDIFGLLVDQHGAAGIAARLEEGAALGRKVVIHADIGDDISAFVVVALHAQAELRANRRARAVGGQHIVGLEAIIAGRRGDAERHAVIAAIDAGQLALPAHVDEVAGGDRVVQILLDILLLQIVHRQVFFARGMRHLEPEDLFAAVVAAAEAPAQRLVEERRDRPDPLQDMHARPRDAERAAAVVKGILAVEQHAADSVARQHQCRGHADRAGADDHDRVPRRDAVQFGDMPRREVRIVK